MQAHEICAQLVRQVSYKENQARPTVFAVFPAPGKTAWARASVSSAQSIRLPTTLPDGLVLVDHMVDLHQQVLHLAAPVALERKR